MDNDKQEKVLEKKFLVSKREWLKIITEPFKQKIQYYVMR
jgi:hypothetical protein